MKVFFKLALISCFTFATSVVCAQDDVEEVEVSGEESVEGIDNSLSLKKAPKKYFHILPVCRRANGVVEVLRPGSEAWVAIDEGKFYPLGTKYRTVGEKSELLVRLGKEISVLVKGNSSFGTRAQALAEKSRTIILDSGTIELNLPRNMPDDLFVVSADGFKAVDLKGESAFTCVKTANSTEINVRCVTGNLSIEGRHFKIPEMKVANEIKINTSFDMLYTGLHGVRGDYTVVLDQGRVLHKDYATGETNEEDKTLEWRLSPKTAVRIHRAFPAFGEKMAVTVMTFDAIGVNKNRCAFTEQRSEINSGELGNVNIGDNSDLMKKAAEATDVAVGEEIVEEKSKDSDESSDDLPSSVEDTADEEFDF